MDIRIAKKKKSLTEAVKDLGNVFRINLNGLAFIKYNLPRTTFTIGKNQS